MAALQHPEHENFAPRTPRVLHIEDDAEFSAALKARLEAHGVTVVRAFTGKEGYQTIFQYPADVILLDLEMPHGGGECVLAELQAHPATEQIPVIILTGAKDDALRRRLLARGAAAFFHKPCDFAALREELARHIEILAAPQLPLAPAPPSGLCDRLSPAPARQDSARRPAWNFSCSS
jgi:DNA-binding response OmpR family regulator